MKIELKKEEIYKIIPNPSSLKDLLTDRSLYQKLHKRLKDEAEDMSTCNR